MKKCNDCEAILPSHYEICPKCKSDKLTIVLKKDPETNVPVQVTREQTFGSDVMACHSYVKAE